MGSRSGDRPTVAVIDLAALRANFAAAGRLAGSREVIAVVKADAYGHGVLPVAGALAAAGCRRLAVVSVAEAAVLRGAGVPLPILVLGGVHDAAEAAAAAELRLTPVVHHAGHAELLAKAASAGPLGVHVEVDTAMHRMGAAPDEAVPLLAAIARTPRLHLEGVFTHFARADEPDLAPTFEQTAAFRRLLEAARARGVDPGLIHAANSAALLAGDALARALPEAGAVRPGLMLYGVRPAPHSGPPLEPVMTLRTRVVQLRALRPDDPVGYGATFRAPGPTRVATLPLGYADGVPVSASNRGRVWLGGRLRPIVGRVSMDYVGVDVGDDPVQIGDEAVLFGRGLPVEAAAAAAGTIAYELLVRVGARVPRVVVEA